MRKDTVTKTIHFLAAHPVGSTIVGLSFHDIGSAQGYPSWATLKRNGIVEKISEETVIWGYSDGGEEPCDCFEVAYNKYKVVGLP